MPHARRTFSILAATILLGFPALAQDTAPPNLPAKVLVFNRQIDIAADGSSTVTTHNETRILTQNAIALLGQLKVNYSDQLQQVDVSGAYTLKPDGRKLAVGPDAIITQQAPASQNAPMLTDLKQRVIIFPDVEVGDTLVYDAVMRNKPPMPGNFFYDALFPFALPLDDATISISAPKTMALTTDNRILDIAKSIDGDRQLYKVHYSNQHPVISAIPQAEYDLAPRFSISSFKDYDAMAAAYAVLAAPAVTVTPPIQAKADEITAGPTDRKEQARKIYEWISTHVRYVALELGQGSIVPHEADRVLANSYGDCKDQAVLYAAMLKAKGIAANLVLINVTNGYTASKAPTIAPFNHMIVWLPDFRFYADTTNGRYVPFGLLPSSEYGKPVVVVGASTRGALRQVPLNDGAGSTVTYKLILATDDAGHVSSNSSISGTGDFSIPLRALGGALQGQDTAKIANNILQKSSTPRATGMITAAPPDPGAPSYGLSATYSTPGIVNGLARGGPGTNLQDNLRPISPFSPALFGPLIDGRFRDAAAAPCFNGHAVDDETLQYPATRHLASLPSDSKLSSPHVTYTSHWTSDGNSVTVHREFTAHFDQVLCSGAARDEMLAASDRIKADIQTRVSVPHLDENPVSAPAAP